MLRSATVLLMACVVGAVACVPDALPPREPVTFVLPTAARADFLDTPFPSDLLILDDGRLDLRTFPNPFNSATLEDFLRIFETAPAWAGTSTLYFKVEGGVDESTLPIDARASVDDDSGLFIVELDGPSRGRHLPIEWENYPAGTAFLPPGTIAVNLLLGAVPQGRFALVATSTIKHQNGTRLGPSDDLRALIACEVPAAVDRAVDCAPWAALPETLGLDVNDIAVATVVTPQDSSRGLLAANDVARAYTPVVSDIRERPTGQNALYTTYDGVIRLAQFQAGTPPFDIHDGSSGGFVFDDDGIPIVQAEEDIPFTLTVPKGQTMPGAGWPVVVNGHGTGGDLNSGLGTRAGAEAFHITQARSAMFAISEPLHFTRTGYREGQEESLTFNFFNPLAGRDNWRQSALEKVMQVTALSTMNFVGVDGAVRFDAGNIGYFGHSQGGIVGGLFVGIEDRITGALLSGAGAGFAPSVIEKTEPVVIANVLKLVLQIPDDEPVDRFHPVPALLQTFVDAADPLNYGAAWRHRRGRQTPHLVVTSGLLDTFTPKRNHSALAGAFGLPQASPVAEQLEILDILGIDDVGDAVVSGNLRTDDGEPLTAAIMQYPADGHFAVFNNPAAQALFTQFFATLLDGTPTASTNP